MFKPLSGLFMIICSLLWAEPVYADDNVVQPENALPKRETPVPKIEGYADWKFTDSIETLKSDTRLTFIEQGEEKCDFGKEEQRERNKWPDCFYYSTRIFQEPAEITILVSQEKIERIAVRFNRRDSKTASNDCRNVLNAVVDPLVNKYGIPTSKNVDKKQLFWESPQGGKIEFRNNCISEGRGMVLFVFYPTLPLENTHERRGEKSD